MSKHQEHKQHSHGHHEHSSGHAGKGGIHRDWRLWVAVVLMLAAMGAYVATMDEAVLPGGQIEAEVPADAE